MKGYCSICGELTDVKAVEVGYVTEFLCRDCMNEREEEYEYIQKDCRN